MVYIFTTSLRKVYFTFSFRTKDQKVGEGTYAVVYRGRFSCELRVYNPDIICSGREAATGRKVAIKKIKVGQFKDGLDMSAIREVKYLRELQHQNVIEVGHDHWLSSVTLTGCCQLLDVFSSKTNLNLVLEFLDTDLEMIIKDRALVFLPADIKSWMAMTFRGLEFCHRNFILHRVNKFISIEICLQSTNYIP
jgi:cyclin-dependent kinase 7